MAQDNKGNGFPSALLKQPSAARYNYFRSYTVAHPKLREANEDLSDAIREAIPGSLIFVFGPSGVGKTTLRLRTEQKIATDMLAELEADPGRFSTIGVEAIPPDSGNFNWKDFYKAILKEMDEPCINYKVKRSPYNNGNRSALTNSHTSSSVFREAAAGAIKHRRPIACFVDEAQHLAKMSSGRKLQDQLDSIKSFGSTTKILIALVGTYELLALRNLSAQLSRRSIDVHFPRYRADYPDEIRAFKNVLWSFQNHLPLDEQPDLVGNWEYFYERSIGCVGVLKDWLARALKKALKDGGKTLEDKHLAKSALSISQCEKMIAEAIEGEKASDDESHGSRSMLRTLLHLDSLPAKRSPNNRDSIETNDRLVRGRKPLRRVGERRPTRDPIGKAVG
jgi:hypothetical protein